MAASGNMTMTLPQCFWITSGDLWIRHQASFHPSRCSFAKHGGAHHMPLTGQHSGSPSAHPIQPLLPVWALFWLLFLQQTPKATADYKYTGDGCAPVFTDIWFYLQSETLDLNLGMEQEVRFQSSKINPLGGSNEARFLSLRYSLKADGSRESVLSSKPHSWGALKACAQLLSSLKICWSYSPLYQLLLHQP